MPDPAAPMPAAAPADADEPRRMLRGAGVFGALTAASRGLGVFRDMALTYVLSGAARDAFLLALTIPNLFRNLFGEGALTNSFVPAYVERLEAGDRAGANRLAGLAATALVALLAALAALLAAGALAAGLFPGLPAKTALTLRLLAVMAPFLPLVCLYAFFLAVLASHRRFAASGAGPALWNLAILAGLGLAWTRWGAASHRAAFAAAAAVVAGGAFMVAIELPALWRAGVRLRPELNLRDQALRGVLRTLAPVLVGTGAYQINVLANRLMAAALVPGGLPAQSWLALSNVLVMAPMGVIAASLSTAALPALAALHARGDRKGFGQALTGSMRMGLFLLVPVAAVLLVAGEPIIRMLYERARGGWRPEETAPMARVLCWSAAAMVPTVLTMLAARALYAMKLPRVPARIAVITVAANLGLSLLLVRSGPVAAAILARTRLGAGAAEWVSGAPGLALATMLAGLLQATLMLRALRRACPGLDLEPPAWSGLRTAGMSVLAAIVAHLVMRSLPPTGEGFVVVAQRAIAPVLGAVFAYWLIASLAEADEYREFWKALRRGKAKKEGQDDDEDRPGWLERLASLFRRLLGRS